MPVTIASHEPTETTVISASRAVLIRSIRAYLQTLVALLVAGGASKAIPFNTFWQLFLTSAGLSLAAAVVSALQNAAELLARLDEKAPGLRA